MHELEFKVLKKFKKEPNKEISTTEIIKEVFPEEYEEIKRYLHEPGADKETKRIAKRKKGMLHRKILYHLNKLIEDNLIKVSKIEGKGEKHFVLSADEEEVVIDRDKKKIIISKPTLPTYEIEGYERQHVIKKFEENTWLSRVNSILIESSLVEGANKLYSLIYELFSNVNDCIGINNFEGIIERTELGQLIEFLKKVDIDTKDYNKRITLIIDFEKIDRDDKIIDFIQAYSTIESDMILILFYLNHKEMQKHGRIIKNAVKEFQKNKIKINIQNKGAHKAPYILGRAGPYTFDEQEWLTYKNSIQGKSIAICCSQTTLGVDVYNFFKEYKQQSEFRKLTTNASKTLLTANNFQRRKSEIYFKNMLRIEGIDIDVFFNISRNYIRYWNYNWQKENQEHIFELLKNCGEESENFYMTEQSIYKSCGIPVRFNIAFSSAFNKFDQDFFSKRNYVKTMITKLEDYYKDEVKDFIRTREQIIRIFDGGDRIRFFRGMQEKPEEIIHEFNQLLNSYQIPLLCYDFEGMRGNMTLSKYMG
jgi:hypothetical protein